MQNTENLIRAVGVASAGEGGPLAARSTGPIHIPPAYNMGEHLALPCC